MLPPAQIQNLLLVFVFATLHDVGIASTWEIIRQGMRVCVKYGFHSRETAIGDLLQEHLRRRIFWQESQKFPADRYTEVTNLTDALEAWYNSSIVKPTPPNAYETKQYLDINFHRERMKFLSYLVLPSDNAQNTTASIDHLWQYTLSAYQILLAYQKQSNDSFLKPNWMYVQDVLKSGFGILYCAVGIPEHRRQQNEGVSLTPSELDTVVNALKLCGETLSKIMAEWQTVQRHTNAFMQMSEAVLEPIASTTRNATREQSHAEHGGERLEETMDWNFDALDSTLNMFQGEGIEPFTDAEWAELFELAVEVDGELMMPMQTVAGAELPPL
ncbi:hypothetical protein CDV31_007024 [Fusarium ambrosium]|uniref:Transcription factor domain-containing protein n=1 Tax=Fusarium ambrosium TaxID=131363 RepID=A0A428U9I0_9HYPO|nr:hypothetical protein CDV31_007024 [Fusarium ambrosium]